MEITVSTIRLSTCDVRDNVNITLQITHHHARFMMYMFCVYIMWLVYEYFCHFYNFLYNLFWAVINSWRWAPNVYENETDTQVSLRMKTLNSRRDSKRDSEEPPPTGTCHEQDSSSGSWLFCNNPQRLLQRTLKINIEKVMRNRLTRTSLAEERAGEYRNNKVAYKMHEVHSCLRFRVN